MATETFYIRDYDSAGTEFLQWCRSPEAASATTNPNATCLSQWTVAKLAAPRYGRLSNGLTQATFVTSPVLPDATAITPTLRFNGTQFQTYGDPWSIGFGVPWNGYFPAGTWTFSFPVIALNSGGSQDGRINVRVHKASSTGTNVTEITSAVLNGTIVTNLATAATQTSTVTWSAPAFYLDNEYLYTNIAWEITGAGGANNAAVALRRGVSSTLVTPSFRRRIYNMT